MLPLSLKHSVSLAKLSSTFKVKSSRQSIALRPSDLEPTGNGFSSLYTSHDRVAYDAPHPNNSADQQSELHVIYKTTTYRKDAILTEGTQTGNLLSTLKTRE